MPKKTSGKSAPRRRKQAGKIQDLPAKARRAAAVKGGGGFTGGVRVAAADVTGDGKPD